MSHLNQNYQNFKTVILQFTEQGANHIKTINIDFPVDEIIIKSVTGADHVDNTTNTDLLNILKSSLINNEVICVLQSGYLHGQTLYSRHKMNGARIQGEHNFTIQKVGNLPTYDDDNIHYSIVIEMLFIQY